MTPRIARAVALAFTAACSQDPRLVIPRSFERPTAVAFACYARVGGASVPLEVCESGSADHTLTALVSQSTRGEIAAVDLVDDVLVDTDARIPGYTFVPSAEVPTDLVVPRGLNGNPRYAYVASFGASLVEAMPLPTFRPDLGGVAAPSVRVALPAEPVALALSPDERFLYASLPRLGAIAELALVDGLPTEPRIVMLDPTIPAPVDLRTLDVVPDPTAAQKICSPDAVLPPPDRIAPRAPLALGEVCRPAGLVIDPLRGRLLVADEQRPIIHVLELGEGGATVGAPLAPAVPVSALALTPPVPTASSDDPGATARYLYAVDAVSHSLLVIDESSGAVLPVSADPTEPDRLVFSSPVRAMTVLAPGYSDAEAPSCSPDDAARTSVVAPGMLRGVFVAAALGDGTIRYVDVEDLDRTCRGGAGEACDGPFRTGDVRVFIRRHAPRIGAFIDRAPRLDAAPFFVVEGSAVRVEVDGSAIASALGLTPFDTCPAGTSAAYPASDLGAPLVCVTTDPYRLRSQQWVATYGGAIPGSATGGAKLSAGGCTSLGGEGGDACVSFATTFDACAAGVLGRDDAAALPEGTPERGYGGDRLVVRGRLLEPISDACRAFEDATDALIEPSFPILRAGSGSVLLGASDTVLSDGSFASIEGVRACFGDALETSIAAGDAYVVLGAAVGFGHRVVTSAEGRCTVDTAAPATRDARLLPGGAFDDGRVAFRLRPLGEAAPERGTQLVFNVVDVPPPLFTDLGERPITPARIAEGPDEHLYLVDQSSFGLARISVSPLGAQNYIRVFE